MHILMTDILTCPRCGPGFGLILIADRMSGRRIVEGALGCANCREKYPIRDGIADFTGGTGTAGATSGAPDAMSGAVASGAAEPEPAEAALRLAALAGVRAGPAYMLLAGGAARHAASVAGVLEDVEVVTATPAAEVGPVAPDATVSRLAVAGTLPLASARLAAVVLQGAAADVLLEDGARVVAPLGRLVLEPAPADAATRLESAGMRIVLQENDTIIAVNRHAAGGA